MSLLTHYFIALFATGGTLFSLALVVLLNGPGKRLNQMFALYSVSVACWSGFSAFAITSDNAALALWLWRISQIGTILIPVFFVHFVFTSINVSGGKKQFIPLSYFVSFIFLVLDATPLFVLDAVPKFSFRYFIHPGFMYYPFFLIWSGWAIYGLVELFGEYFRAAGYKKNQLKYFCWPMLIAYIGGVPNFFPTFNIEIPILIPFGTYAIPIYAFFTVYAIVRFRLMDIDILIRKTAIYSILTALITGLALSFIVLGELLFREIVGYSSVWATIAAVFLIAIIFRPLQDWIQRIVDKLFFKSKYDYRKTVKDLSQNLVTMIDRDQVVDITTQTVIDTLKAKHASIYLLGEKSMGFRRVE